jgi:zinc protease
MVASLHRRIALPLAAAALALATAASAGEAERVTSVEGITEYKLPNGLHVLLFPDTTKQTITVNITYLVGSRHEGYGETGMAHLLEHMVFKGTPNHPNIPQELTAHGARPNGTTSFDRTNYFETFQATEENLKWALELESDRMVNSYVARKDLDTEMTVVRNEYESGENSPQGVLIKRVLATMFDWHNYGKLPIGARSDIENVPIERLQAFYHRYYQPDNAVLTIAGKIDQQKTLALVVEAFGKVPRPERKLIPTYTAEPTQDGERSVTLRRTGDVQLVMGAYHAPAGSHADAAPMEVLSFILGDTPAGRLHKALVEGKKAAAAFTFYWSLREPGMLILGAEVRQEQSLDDARKELLATADALAQKPVSAEEVERAKTHLLKNITLTLNQADIVGLRLSEFIAKGDWRLFFLNRDRLRKVTVDDVQRVAVHYLKPSNRTVGEFVPTANPERVEVPAPADLAALLKGYVGDKAVAQGEAFDPAPANIDARTHRGEQGGLKLSLLPKKTRGGTVIVNLTLHYGDLKSLTGKSAAADLAVDMLMRGSKQHTRQQLQDELDKLKARMSINAQLGDLHAHFETTRENLPAVFKLLAEALRSPTFPEQEFEQLRQENLAAIEQQKSDPGSMANTAFARHQRPYPRGDPRYTELPGEAVDEYKKATLAEVKEVYENYLGASHGELAVVGDFDEKELGQLAGELLSGWTAKLPYERIPQPHQDVEPAAQTLDAPDKANAVFIAGQTFKLRDTDADYPALLLGNYMLGGGFLNSRLAVRIRQKEGLSYGVRSSLSARALDDNGSFEVWAIHAPQNTQKLEVAVREELSRMLKEGFTEEEISQAKSGWQQSRQVGRAQDNALGGTLRYHAFIGRTFAFDAELETKVAALTAEQIVETMRKYIDPAKLTIVRAGDFKKADKAASR